MTESTTPRTDAFLGVRPDSRVEFERLFALSRTLETELRAAVDGLSEESSRSEQRHVALLKWRDFAQTLTGVDANDHGWLRAELESQWRKSTDYAEALQRDLLKACAIGMSTILVRVGAYESLNPYMKGKYDELAALHAKCPAAFAANSETEIVRPQAEAVDCRTANQQRPGSATCVMCAQGHYEKCLWRAPHPVLAVGNPPWEALILAATTFRRYAKLHRDKGTEDGWRKAAENDRLAEKMEAAQTILSQVRPQEPVLICPDRDGACPTAVKCRADGCQYTGAPL